ncbi:MAG: TIR domain-containing protein [Candidatus Cloacimonetes bacterium]|nr:TIR domain-containing protein [Candidatus Cloacimonadota bacterium]
MKNERRKVFVSFRYKDGAKIKEDLIENLEALDIIIDKSEDEDRSHLSEESIKEYLFEKLRDSSITIVILTPKALQYYRKDDGDIDDWLYDELRYSLYDRTNNRINGVIALYTQESKPMLFDIVKHSCNKCNEVQQVFLIKPFDNLVYDNVLNIKTKYKHNKCEGLFDADFDSYISLIALEDFYNNPLEYLKIATEKREKSDEYQIKVRKD